MEFIRSRSKLLYYAIFIIGFIVAFICKDYLTPFLFSGKVFQQLSLISRILLLILYWGFISLLFLLFYYLIEEFSKKYPFAGEKPLKKYFVIFWLIIAVMSALLNIAQAKQPQERKVYSDLATHVMIASSVWNDFDYKYSLEDLSRFRVDFPSVSGPYGLFLKTSATGDLVYAKQYLYGSTAALFYGLFGVNGFIVFNSICLLIIGWTISSALAKPLGEQWSLLVSLGLILPGPFMAWVPIPHPDLFIAALLASSTYLLLRLRTHNKNWELLLGGFLMGAVIYEKLTFIVILPFILLALHSKIKLRRIIFISFIAAGAWLILSLPGIYHDGNLTSYQGTRFYVARSPFPLENGWSLPQTGFTDHIFDPALVFQSLVSNLTIIPAKIIDFIIGRQSGMLVYFPMALFLLFLRIQKYQGKSLWLIGSFFAYMGLNWLTFPTNGYGGAGSYGPRYIMQALPLIPMAFLGCKTRLQTIQTSLAPLGKYFLLTSLLLAVLIHWRVPFAGDEMVKHYYKWYLEPPLSFFPVEKWLLPTTAQTYPLPYKDQSSTSPHNTIYHMAYLNQKTFFAASGNSRNETIIFYQSDASVPLDDLELLSNCDVSIALTQNDNNIWQGAIKSGQPAFINLDQNFSLETTAYDLGSNTNIGFGHIDLVIEESDVGHYCAKDTPIIRFAREHKIFKDYGHMLSTKEFSEAGVATMSGWSNLEPWGVWSNGKFSEILIYAGESSNLYEVTFQIKGYTPTEDPVRKVKITANGRLIGELDLSDETETQNYTFQFNTKPDEEFIYFGLLISNPISPYELDRGYDVRRLGIGLSGFQLKKLDN